eukprot:UN3538
MEKASNRQFHCHRCDLTRPDARRLTTLGSGRRGKASSALTSSVTVAIVRAEIDSATESARRPNRFSKFRRARDERFCTVRARRSAKSSASSRSRSLVTSRSELARDKGTVTASLSSVTHSERVASDGSGEGTCERSAVISRSELVRDIGTVTASFTSVRHSEQGASEMSTARASVSDSSSATLGESTSLSDSQGP